MEPTAPAPTQPTATSPGAPPTANTPSAPSQGWWSRIKGWFSGWVYRIVTYLIASAIAYVVFQLTGKRVEVQFVPLPMTAEQMQANEFYNYEGCSFHGDVEHLHDEEALPARWPSDQITYRIDYDSASRLSPPLSREAIRDAIRQAFGWWTDSLQIEFIEVTDGNAHIPISFRRMDGVGGVLAQAYLADGTNRQKPLEFDSSERWTAGAPASGLVSLPTVGCHEIGHSLGLHHDATNAPAVMRPQYTQSIPREQPRDIDRAVQLGYTRRPRVPPAAVDVLTVSVQIRTVDVIDAIKKAGYGVEPPPKILAP